MIVKDGLRGLRKRRWRIECQRWKSANIIDRKREQRAIQKSGFLAAMMIGVPFSSRSGTSRCHCCWLIVCWRGRTVSVRNWCCLRIKRALVPRLMIRLSFCIDHIALHELMLCQLVNPLPEVYHFVGRIGLDGLMDFKPLPIDMVIKVK